jgi:hypothetical protein
MTRYLVALVLVMVVSAANKVNGVKLELELAKMLKEVNASRSASKAEEKVVQNETATFLAGSTDKVAAAVDQTLVGAAEEKLADKQAEVCSSENSEVYIAHTNTSIRV